MDRRQLAVPVLVGLTPSGPGPKVSSASSISAHGRHAQWLRLTLASAARACSTRRRASLREASWPPMRATTCTASSSRRASSAAHSDRNSSSGRYRQPRRPAQSRGRHPLIRSTIAWPRAVFAVQAQTGAAQRAGWRSNVPTRSPARQSARPAARGGRDSGASLGAQRRFNIVQRAVQLGSASMSGVR